jgi:hypothetical protein
VRDEEIFPGITVQKSWETMRRRHTTIEGFLPGQIYSYSRVLLRYEAVERLNVTEKKKKKGNVKTPQFRVQT